MYMWIVEVLQLKPYFFRKSLMWRVREKKWEKLGLNGVGEFIFSTFESYNSKPQKPSSEHFFPHPP
jgi:hypothetical protein